MAATGQGDIADNYENVREPGTRRKKLAGYLRAANEIRQSYTQSWSGRGDSDNDRDMLDFNDVANVSTSEAQMILFPSYARAHGRVAPTGRGDLPSTRNGDEGRAGTGDADFWRKQWEQYENDRAVVDVDVRGWVFNPHTGPLSRKNRLMVTVLRQVAGIPGPNNKTSPGPSAVNSRQSSPTRRPSALQEEQIASQQAEAIVRKGQAETEVAKRGSYSEQPKDTDASSTYGDDDVAPSLPPRRQTSSPSNATETVADSVLGQSSTLTPAELAVANINLMKRFKPFLSNPLSNSTINVFFYNETTSRQKTIMTDAYGHFTLRASLEFVPTHVRVMASERLSVQEEVEILAARGVSLISDIDDTVRHTAILKGTREMARNALIRDFSTLTVAGVKEWYSKLVDMGVQIHYVSNSPWQLFPALKDFFAVAQLPKGTFNLKQYNSVLQGLFEPVAERKKATLNRILADFPDRKFVLVGDSGEADLEVYTDVVLEHPGRVLGVFIRDVTTTPGKGFFDPSTGPSSGRSTPKGRQSRNHSVESLSRAKRRSHPNENMDDEVALQAAIAASLRSMELETEQRRRSVFSEKPAMADEKAPTLPPRLIHPNTAPVSRKDGNELGDLIDFGDEDSSAPIKIRSPPPVPRKPLSVGSTAAMAGRPPPPSKPVRLRSPSMVQERPAKIDTNLRPPPPLPRKPSSSVLPVSPSPLQQVQLNSPDTTKPPPLPDRQDYRSQAKQKMSSVYNALPSATSLMNGPSTGYTPRPLNSTYSSQVPGELRPFSSTGRASTANSAPPSGNGKYWTGQDPSDESTAQPASKQEMMWKRRWLRAKDIMDRKGVMLRTWRVGPDVMDECVAAVQQELETMHGHKPTEEPKR